MNRPLPYGPKVAALLAAPLLWSCTVTPKPPSPSAAAEAWHAVPLPGKRPTRYAAVRKEGRAVVHARAEQSASMWRRTVHLTPDQLGEVRWVWRADGLIDDASVADVDREDAVARVVFAFDGDRSRLSPRNRAMFDLAQALTGEAPPYATLMYVWETSAPEGSVIVNPRTDRVRKIVVDSGRQHLKTWREHRRNLAEDFRRAFGEDPGPLVGIAVMTDADNTRSRAEAWYGPIELAP
jgi:hypothetical protein